MGELFKENQVHLAVVGKGKCFSANQKILSCVTKEKARLNEFRVPACKTCNCAL